MRGNWSKAPREWNGSERRGLPWAREKGDQGCLAIWLELEAKEACRLPSKVWPRRSSGHRHRQTESQEHADRQHQTPTGQICGPKHGQMGTWQLPWAGPHSHQDRVTGGCYYRRVSAHSPQADPEGGSEGHSGKLG